MNSSFDRKLKNYLTVYKIPIGPNQLDPTVFYFPSDGTEPKLQPQIHSQIIKDLNFFTGEQPERIDSCYLVGPATVPGTKNRTGELKIVIVLNKNLKDVDVDGLLSEIILKTCKRMSGKLATGTTRPIRYVPTIRKIEDQDYKGVYDINKFEWKKLPNGLTK